MLDINIFLQDVGTPFWDSFFLFVSNLTNELLYIAIIAFIYYAIDKEKSIRMAVIVMSNMSLNFLLKDIFCIDRPYVKDKSIINKDINTGYGYSFPSGHSQFNSGFYSSLTLCFNLKKYYLWIVFFVVLVGFSRIYLGVHSIADVIAGLLIGYIWSIAIEKLLKKFKKKQFFVFMFLGIIGISNVVISKNIDGIKILLLYFGFVLGYYFEKKYIKYVIPKKVLRRVINVFVFMLGVIVIMIIAEFVPKDISLFKYFLVGLWATFLCPSICRKRKV